MSKNLKLKSIMGMEAVVRNKIKKEIEEAVTLVPTNLYHCLIFTFLLLDSCSLGVVLKKTLRKCRLIHHLGIL